jgi:glycosyltransferase involved in cell wall biosynthesis
MKNQTTKELEVVRGKVSVVIPVRFVNRNWLNHSISSVLNQDYSNIEVIIVNDEATEDIDDLVTSFGIKKYVKNEKNMGPSYSNNKGFEFADGEYFYKHDADDYLLPGMISRFVKELEEHRDFSIVWGTHIYVDDHDNYLGTSTDYFKKIASLAGCNVSSGLVDRKFTFFGVSANCWLHRREVWDKIKYDETLRFNTDFSFWLRSSREFKIWRISLNEKPFSAYRLHSNSIGVTLNKSSKPKVGILMQEAQMYPEDQNLKRAIKYWTNYDENLAKEMKKEKLKKRVKLIKFLISHPRSLSRIGLRKGYSYWK